MENQEKPNVEGGAGAFIYLIVIGFIAYLLLSALF